MSSAGAGGLRRAAIAIAPARALPPSATEQPADRSGCCLGRRVRVDADTTTTHDTGTGTGASTGTGTVTVPVPLPVPVDPVAAAAEARSRGGEQDDSGRQRQGMCQP